MIKRRDKITFRHKQKKFKKKTNKQTNPWSPNSCTRSKLHISRTFRLCVKIFMHVYIRVFRKQLQKVSRKIEATNEAN